MFKAVASALLICAALIPSAASANEVDVSASHVRATVVRVMSESTKTLEGIQVTSTE